MSRGIATGWSPRPDDRDHAEKLVEGRPRLLDEYVDDATDSRAQQLRSPPRH